MQQLSLFIDGFDPVESIQSALQAPSVSGAQDDLFGFTDADAADGSSILSDGAVAPSSAAIASLLPSGSDSEETGEFFSVSAVDENSSATDLDDTATKAAALPESTRVRADTVQRTEAPWPLLTSEGIGGHGGDVAKFDANIAAIRLLQQLEAEQRQPSDAERLVLQRYTGWGGLKDAIDGAPSWVDRRSQLRDLLSEDEFKSARDSVLNAHYTEPSVVSAVWAAVERLGFKGGRVLDPSAGTGHFYGAMPQAIAMRSDLYAVEIDEVSSRIHKALYGHACRMDNVGYEKVDYPQGWFDLVITNVPFGNYPVPCGARKPYSRWSIHNYFIAKSLEIVRPGGLVAVITSTFTMDAADEKRRAWMKSQAELVGAIRLPAGTFSRIAKTDVTTDILLLRRRETGEVMNPAERDYVGRVEIDQAIVQGAIAASHRMKNVYWANHPECVLGNWVTRHAMHAGWNLAVEMTEGESLEAKLEEAIATLPAGVYRHNAEKKQPLRQFVAEDCKSVKTGSHVIHNGLVHRLEGGSLKRTTVSGTREKRVRGLIQIRDQVRKLLSAQTSPDSSDAVLSTLRLELNRLYDSFVAKQGWISSRGNSLAFRTDPDWPLLLALEHYDDEKDVAVKAAIFTERTTRPSLPPTKADSPETAAVLSMAEYGHINPAYIAMLLGQPEKDVLEQLSAAEVVYVDPETGHYVPRDEYLSGNVRKKLAHARQAGIKYDRNVKALEKVIPADVPPGDIDARLGVTWVTGEEYKQFIEHLAGSAAMRYATKMEVQYEPVGGAWTITDRLTDTAFEQQWGTKDMPALTLMVEAMNGRSATCRDPVYDLDKPVRYVVNVENTAAARERQAKMSDEFQKWLWADPVRSELLVRRYNDEYNSYVQRRFDGSHLRLEGFSWCVQPSPHQLNGIARAMTGANLLLAHVVGAGKTLTMVCAAMEMRRTGLRNKPLHVVPNQLLYQYAGEFLRAYPNAKLLIASKEDLSKERRKEFVARVALGDWDSVVMTHSTFERIPADPALSKRLMDEILAEVGAILETSKKNREDRTKVKQLVKIEKLWKAKLETLEADWKKDDFFSLADLGVDHLLYDEAHLAKNLVRVTQMDRVAGLPNTDSQRAFDLFIKTKQMSAIHGGRERGVVLATGTPVANSMAELHVMQRLLQPQTLREHNLDSFDAWAAQFGRVITSLEVSPDGGTFRMSERFAQFVNLPELMSMFRQVADIQTKEMLNLPTPPLVGGAPQTIVVKASEPLKAYIDKLVARAEAIRNRQVKPDEDNMLAVTTDGRKAALDLRLVDRHAVRDPGGKIEACIAKTHELWLKSESFRGTQMIFCDMGTPGAPMLDVYEEIKQGLMSRGIPEHEIAFIHDAKTDQAKSTLFRNMREGRIRVLIASTLKAGVGTNVQTLLYALHNLDVPWRPCDIEQREGRIERRGNLCDAVYVFRYITEGSFDAYSWQTLAAKMGFISQVMTGETTVRKIQDVSLTALSYEEVKAIACGNPLVKEKAQLDTELKRLEMLYGHHKASARNAKWELDQQVLTIRSRKEQLAAIAADDAVVEATGEVLELNGQTFTGYSEEAKAALGALTRDFDAMAESREARHTVGSFCGLPLVVKGSGVFIDSRQSCFVLGGRYVQTALMYVNGQSAYRGLVEAIENRKKDVAKLNASIEAADRAIPVLQIQMAAKFDKMDRLEEVRQRLVELEAELGLNKNEAGTEAMDSTTSLANKLGVSGSAVDEEVDEALAVE